MRITVVTLAATTFAAVLLAACGGGAHHATAKPPATVATHSQDCASRVQAWAHAQGSAQLNQFTHDTETASRDLAKAAAGLRRRTVAADVLARWQGAATALETDAQAASSNPPPACANASGYGIAMQDYTTAAKDYTSAATDISAGSYGGAAALIRSGTSAMRLGNSALNQVAGAIAVLNG